MKTKLLTLLTLLVMCVTGAWADTVVGKDTSTSGTIIYYNTNSGSSNVTITNGADDNGIYPVSGTTSLKKGPAEISLADNAVMMVCVDDITTGSITITLKGTGNPTGPDWSDTSAGSDGRYFQLYVGETAQKKYLYSKYSTTATTKDDTGLTYDSDKIRGVRTIDFTSSELTTVGGKNYLKFKALGGEMKPY